MSSGLGHRIAKSAAWMVGSRLAIRVIGLVSTVILARLLRPEDFGLVALVMALVGTLDVFGNFSFDLALIRDGQAMRDHYDTVWTLSIIRGAFVAGALVALAWPAAAFFGDPRVQPIIYWVAGGMFLEGCQNIGTVDFRKELTFHREFAFQIAGKLLTFAVTVTLAFLWREYWALVAGIVVGKIGNLILSFLMHPYRPRLSLKEWRGLVGFSKWLLASNIANFLSGRIDTFSIGKIIGTHALGLYEIANEISNLPTGELIWPIQRALFPGYAKLMGDANRLAAGYVNGLAAIIMIALPAAAGIACTAPLIIDVFLGPAWREALPLLQILAIAGILKVGYANAYTVLLALGRVKLLSHLSTMNLVIFGVLVLGGTLIWGSIGAAFASVATAALVMAIYVTITLRTLSIPLVKLLSATWRSLVAASLMALSVWLLLSSWPESTGRLTPITELLAAVGEGVLVYLAMHLALWRLSGSPPGAEQDALALLLPLARRWRTSLASRTGPS